MNSILKVMKSLNLLEESKVNENPASHFIFSSLFPSKILQHRIFYFSVTGPSGAC